MGVRRGWTVLNLSVGRGRRRNGRKGYGNDRKVLMRGEIIVTRFRCDGRTRGSTAHSRLQGRNDEMKQLRNPRGRAVSYPSCDLSKHRPTFKWFFFFHPYLLFLHLGLWGHGSHLSHRRMVFFFLAYPAYSMQPWYAKLHYTLELRPFFLLAGLALACTAHALGHPNICSYVFVYFVRR